MAEDPKKKTVEEPAPPKSGGKPSKLKFFLMLVGVVVLVGAGMAGGMYLQMKLTRQKSPATKTDAASELVADAEGKETPEKAHGSTEKEGEKEAEHGKADKESGEAAPAGKTNLVYEMEKVVVNLLDANGRLLVQACIQIEAENAKAKTLVEDNVPPLQDALITILSSKTAEEIRMPAGKERFKRELLARFADILPADTIKNIYLKQMMVIRQP